MGCNLLLKYFMSLIILQEYYYIITSLTIQYGYIFHESEIGITFTYYSSSVGFVEGTICFFTLDYVHKYVDVSHSCLTETEKDLF